MKADRRNAAEPMLPLTVLLLRLGLLAVALLIVAAVTDSGLFSFSRPGAHPVTQSTNSTNIKP